MGSYSVNLLFSQTKINFFFRAVFFFLILLPIQIAAAESIYSTQIQAGWKANIMFSPPAGWVRQNGPDAVWYLLPGVPAGTCSFIFPAPENTVIPDSITAFRDWHDSSVRAGQILHQTELSWGTSTSSGTTFWRMRGAELRLPNGSPLTILSYMGESKSVRQKGVYQCVGVGTVGTQYAGPNGHELPGAISALKGLVVDVERSGGSSMTASQCMSECASLAFELANDCRLSCMKNYK